MDMFLKMIQIYFILTRFHGRKIVQEKIKTLEDRMMDVSEFQQGFPALLSLVKFPTSNYLYSNK